MTPRLRRLEALPELSFKAPIPTTSIPLIAAELVHKKIVVVTWQSLLVLRASMEYVIGVLVSVQVDIKDHFVIRVHIYEISLNFQLLLLDIFLQELLPQENLLPVVTSPLSLFMEDKQVLQD